MKPIYSVMILLFTYLLTACQLTSTKPHTNNFAPDSLVGHKYLMTINYGSGVFAEQGTWTVEFFEDSSYQVMGDGEYSIDSNGHFEYIRNGNYASVNFEDSDIGGGQFILTYVSENSGEFKSTIDAAPKDSQAGTFSQL